LKQKVAQYVLRYINFSSPNKEELPPKKKSVIMPIYKKVVVDDDDDSNCSNYRGL
jgi:hypothetical protein